MASAAVDFTSTHDPMILFSKPTSHSSPFTLRQNAAAPPGYRYWDAEMTLRYASTSYKVRVNSIQGLQFRDMTVRNQHGRLLHRPVVEHARLVKVTLQYPSRMLKMNDFVPDVVVEMLGDKDEDNDG